MAIVPASTPRWTEAKVRQKVGKATEAVVLLGVRGYYRDSMGAVGRNDRGIYDDALFLISPSGVVAFNANTDPSVSRKGIASLKPGTWLYKVGIHGLSKPANRRYTALVQADKVTVQRDNAGEQTGYFGINIHKGGHATTSSLGCQTIYPKQWEAFISLVKSELQRHGQKTIPYILIEEQG